MISSLSYSLTSANSIRRTFKGFAPTEFSKRKLKAEKEKVAKKKGKAKSSPKAPQKKQSILKTS